MRFPLKSYAPDVYVIEPVTTLVSTSKLIAKGGIGFDGFEAESNEKYKLSGTMLILFSNKFKLPPVNVFVF